MEQAPTVTSMQLPLAAHLSYQGLRDAATVYLMANRRAWQLSDGTHGTGRAPMDVDLVGALVGTGGGKGGGKG